MIYAIGSVNADQTARVKHLPQLGETTAGLGYELGSGGKGANQAVAARKAGAGVQLVGCVGGDSLAGVALAELVRVGVGLDALRRVETSSTGLAIITVDGEGNNTIVVVPGANALLAVEDISHALQAAAKGSVVLLQQEIPVACLAEALRIAKHRGLLSILNAAPFIEEARDLAHRADILVVNETEFAQLTDHPLSDDPIADARVLARRNQQRVVITMGGDGAIFATPDAASKVAAPAVKVVDTVGAGDTFCGYLAAAMESGLSFAHSVRRAVIAGSLACQTPGAQPGMPVLAEVVAFEARSAA